MRALVFLLMASASFAFNATATGTCGDVSVMLRGNETGCWDVKIDAPGIVLDEEWKSSFFYAKDAYCNGNGTAKFRPAFDGTEGAIKIRQNNTIIELPFIMGRNCPARPPNFLAVIVLISAMFAGIFVFKKQ
ncbi:MAG TPA: hypothetical protein VI979_04265 [archaeon]|nr:hypothetical protein [archaeon]